MDYLLTQQSLRYWNGAKRQASADEWVWHNSGEAVSKYYQAWRRGEPSEEAGSEACATFWYNDYGWQWYDEPCSESMKVLCEYEVPETD